MDPKPRPIRLDALLVAALAAGAISAAAGPTALTAQVDPSPPDTVAAEFLRGFQTMTWDGLAQRLHPEALAYVRLGVDVVVEADDSGWALTHLGGAESRADYDARSHAQVFTSAMRWIQENAPGLISSLASRRLEAVGVVVETPDIAHAVYRVTTIAFGAEPTVQVATLLRTELGWKVREAPEIRSLHLALRGLPNPPPG